MTKKFSSTIYASSVLPLKEQSLFLSAYESVSQERRKVIDSFKFEKDKCLSLGAELLLKYALNEANIDYENLCIKKNSWGKPSLENNELFYNISHSEEWVICAVSDTEIGCDIEKIQDIDLKVAQQFFCREEFLNIARQTSRSEQIHMLYRYWTLKESFMKATGLGMQLPLNAFCIDIKKNTCVRQSLDERKYSFKEFDNIPGYCCAVCTAQEYSETELKIIDLSVLPC